MLRDIYGGWDLGCGGSKHGKCSTSTRTWLTVTRKDAWVGQTGKLLHPRGPIASLHLSYRWCQVFTWVGWSLCCCACTIDSSAWLGILIRMNFRLKWTHIHLKVNVCKWQVILCNIKTRHLFRLFDVRWIFTHILTRGWLICGGSTVPPDWGFCWSIRGYKNDRNCSH